MTTDLTYAVRALVAGAIVLTATACSAGPAQIPGPAATSPTTGTTSTPSSSPSSSPSSTASSSPSSTAGCATSDLRVRYADDKGSAGAGSVMGTFTFTNTGSAGCTLRGFPGVSYVGGGNGTQVGQAATRTDDAAQVRTLAAGKSVTAALRRTQPGGYGDSCQQTGVDGFRVFPPGSTASTFVAFRTTGCRSAEAPLLQVGPVR